MASSETSTASRLPSARGYQLEMLNESLRRNIVVALDTGSGKTLIAFARTLPLVCTRSIASLQRLADKKLPRARVKKGALRHPLS